MYEKTFRQKCTKRSEIQYAWLYCVPMPSSRVPSIELGDGNSDRASQLSTGMSPCIKMLRVPGKQLRRNQIQQILIENNRIHVGPQAAGR